MKTFLYLFLGTLLLMGPSPMSGAPQQAAGDAAPQTTDSETAGGSGVSAEAGAGHSGAGASEELETIVPTERVPADSAVSFPVDI